MRYARPGTWVSMLAAAALLAGAFAAQPASATVTKKGTIQVVSAVCSFFPDPPAVASPVCPMDPGASANNVFVSTVAIPAGVTKVVVTGTIPPVSQVEPVAKWGVTFSKSPYVQSTPGSSYAGYASGVVIKIAAGSTSIRLSGYGYAGVATNVSWTLTFS